MLVNNRDYEIMTPDGFHDFIGIKISHHSASLYLEFSDGSNIICSEGHFLKLSDGRFVEAEWVDDSCIFHGGRKLIHKEWYNKEIDLYDPVNVGTKHEYIANELVHHNCEFQGSAGTLISGYILKSLSFITPPFDTTIAGLHIYKQPVAGGKYVLVADTSRGKGLDYSAFVVIDVTTIPYNVVCTYKDNDISPITYPSIIAKMGKWYNEAYVLVEINDNGQQVVDSLFDDYEYENILSSVVHKQKVVLSWQYGGKAGERGIRTTKSVKRLGCSLVKTMIESYQLLFQDFHIIAELSTFINKRNSFEADDGGNDDLVMCLVLFAWMTNQPFFADLCNTNIKEKLYREQMAKIDQESLPLPVLIDGSDDTRFVEDGAVWDFVRN
jgi:hypothetical protein